MASTPRSARTLTPHEALLELYIDQCLGGMKLAVWKLLMKGVPTGVVQLEYVKEYDELCIGSQEILQEKLIEFLRGEELPVKLSQHRYMASRRADGRPDGPENLDAGEFMLVRQRCWEHMHEIGLMEHITACSPYSLGVCVRFA